MTKLTIPRRGSQVANVLLFTITSFSSLEAAKGIEPPLLNGPSGAFVAFYGEAKVVDTVLGEVRMWKKGPFLITHVAGKNGPCSISVARTDGAEMSRREAFAIGTRYCGKQDWLVLAKDADSEVCTNADRSLQLTYATPAGREKHVTITFDTEPQGLDHL